MKATKSKKTPLDLTAFFQTTIRHPRIDFVSEEIEIAGKMGSKFIPLVVGPTGVGKTTLGHVLYRRFIKANIVEMTTDPGFVPVAFVEVRAVGSAKFDWRNFYINTLEALGDVTDLPLRAFSRESASGPKIYSYRKTDSESALRMRVENALRARRTKFLILDEGGHFTNVSQNLIDKHTDAIKSLSSCTGCQIILLGCYDILRISRRSSQLARRVREIHFSRYREDIPEDQDYFFQFIQYLESQSGGYFEGLLSANEELLMTNAVGCIGTLMSLVEDFYNRCVATGEVSQENLQKSLLTTPQCKSILEDINFGEEYFGEKPFAEAYKKRARR